MRAFRDPTRDELIREATRIAVDLGSEDPEFDAEHAAYWIAVEFHTGQWSNLYAALCASPYKPGLRESSPSNSLVWKALCKWMKV